jgi:hypothetical protein
MEHAVIAVEGPADRLLMSGLEDLRPVLDELRGSVLIVGGLMTRAWVHARPSPGLLSRATVDVDLGINRRSLRLSGNSKLIEPLLNRAGFEKGLGDNAFQFSRELAIGEFRVDVMVAPGHSRADPPLVEAGVPSIAVPGLAYAILRGTKFMQVQFVDAVRSATFDLPLPALDAAFVMKAALVAKRSRVARLAIDTADAITLAAICANDDDSPAAIAEHRDRSDVKDAISFLESLADVRGATARRIEEHFADQNGITGMGDWSVHVAQAMLERLLR